MNLEIGKMLMRCDVWSVMLYVLDTTTHTKGLNYLQTCEMWTDRKVLKIPWTARMKNNDVLKLANAE